MNFSMNHVNLNVTDLDRSLAFYKAALGLEELRRKESPDFKIVYLTDRRTGYYLELTWLAAKQGKYALGDNEGHVGFTVDDYAAAKARHAQMGCIAYENAKMGIYFIEDPDGYWLEVLPDRRPGI